MPNFAKNIVMKFKLGDRVKFLNASGGGIISKIASPGIVHVAIEDGFDIPTAVSDLILVDTDTAAGRFFDDDTRNDNKGKGKGKPNPEPKPITVKAPVPEEQDYMGERVSALPISRNRSANEEGVYLAFVPQDQKWLITGLLDIYMVNLSSFDVIYSYFVKGSKGGYQGMDYGSIPPYSRIFIESVEREQIELHADGLAQLLFHKDDIRHVLVPVSAEFRIKPLRFSKEDNYREFAFLPEKSFVYLLNAVTSLKPLHEQESQKKYEPEKPETREAKQIQPESFITRHKTAPREAIVDLHIEAMVEDHASLAQNEILNLQLSYFTKCLDSAIADNFYKVTFIHGVGNGILKNALRDRLKEYKSILYQPAPMSKYGVGAIDVTIMHEKTLLD